jgi:hypothetical protein
MKDVVRLEDRSFSVSGISDQPTLMKMYLKWEPLMIINRGRIAESQIRNVLLWRRH